MEKIPTARQYLLKNVDTAERGIDLSSIWTDAATQAMTEFAKLHVQAALEAAAENAKAREDPKDFGTGEIWVDKSSIIEAYPLSNIK
jgi:hypothetical protein